MEAQTTSTAPIILVGSLSAGWFSASPQCPSGSPTLPDPSSLHVLSSRTGFLSLPQVGLAGTQTGVEEHSVSYNTSLYETLLTLTVNFSDVQ